MAVPHRVGPQNPAWGTVDRIARALEWSLWELAKLADELETEDRRPTDKPLRPRDYARAGVYLAHVVEVAAREPCDLRELSTKVGRDPFDDPSRPAQPLRSRSILRACLLGQAFAQFHQLRT